MNGTENIKKFNSYDKKRDKIKSGKVQEYLIVW